MRAPIIGGYHTRSTIDQQRQTTVHTQPDVAHVQHAVNDENVRSPMSPTHKRNAARQPAEPATSDLPNGEPETPREQVQQPPREHPQQQQQPPPPQQAQQGGPPPQGRRGDGRGERGGDEGRRGPGLNITELKDKSIQQLTQIAKDLNV